MDLAVSDRLRAPGNVCSPPRVGFVRGLCLILAGIAFGVEE